MNPIITFNYSLKSFFGLMPSTTTYEKKQDMLLNDYNRLITLRDDPQINKFIELREWISSGAMKAKKKELNAKKYKGTESFNKEVRFKKLDKSKQIKTYYLIKDSEDISFYRTFKDSVKYTDFLKQQEYINSSAFTSDKEKLKTDRINNIAALKKKKTQYKEEKQKLNWFFKLQKKADFKLFLENKDTNDWNSFITLRDEVSKINLPQLKREISGEHKKTANEYYALKKRYKKLQKEVQLAKKKNIDFLKKDELEKVKADFESRRGMQEAFKRKFKETEEYKKVQEFKSKKSQKIYKSCNKYFENLITVKYFEILESKGLADFSTLKDYIENSFKKDLDIAKKQTYKNSDLFIQYNEFKKLKKDPEIKRYKKLAKSKKIATYEQLEGDALIKEYESLKVYVTSLEFIEEKKYLKVNDKFKLSEEYKDLLLYKKLRGSKDVKWFVKNEKTKRFDELMKWKKIFSDEFDSQSLNKEKWLTIPLAGKKMGVGAFSQQTEKQAFDEKSIHIDNSKLSIETKKQKTKGKLWHPQFGFIPKEFDFVSGTINTGDIFDYKYGRIDVKVKFSESNNVEQGVYLSSMKGDKQISILHSKKVKNRNKAHIGVVSGEFMSAKNMLNSIGIKRFSKDYNILSIDWDESKIVWKVNGQILGMMTNDIPTDNMYLNVMSTVVGDTSKWNGTEKLSVDWLRVYHQN